MRLPLLQTLKRYTSQVVTRFIGDGDMSVLCMDLISLARPNFHSTSDCCWKNDIWNICGHKAPHVYLDPLISVWHHGNQEIDQHHGGHQHVKTKHQLEQVWKGSWVPRRHVHILVTDKKLPTRRKEHMQFTCPFQIVKRRVLMKHVRVVSILDEKISCILVHNEVIWWWCAEENIRYIIGWDTSCLVEVSECILWQDHRTQFVIGSIPTHSAKQ